MKLVLIAASIAAYSQATVNAPAVSLDTNGTAALTAWMSGQTTAVKTTLPSGITNATTSITVTSSTGIAANSVIDIGGEHIGVVSKVGDILTVTRGFNGTTAAAHGSGATVVELKYRTFNLLGKAIIIDAMRAIVRQQRQAAIAAAVATANAETEAAVQ